MGNCLWLYWVILAIFAVTPFLMLYIEYKIHRNSIKHTLGCPVWWVMSGSSIAALAVAIHFYPIGMGMVSIFIFGMGLPFAIAASDLPLANRTRT